MEAKTHEAAHLEEEVTKLKAEVDRLDQCNNEQRAKIMDTQLQMVSVQVSSSSSSIGAYNPNHKINMAM